MIGVGEAFPIFSMNAVEGFDMIEVCDEMIEDKWSVIYFYPKDFTFICPTEIQGFDNLVGLVYVIGVSPDNEFCKLAWKHDNALISDINHPLAADSGNELAEELGIVSAEGVPYRATFVVDPDGDIAHISVNQLDTGRNHEELYRTIEALQAGGLTGCNWQPGEDFVA